jgi:hypothetical protein
MSSSFARAMAPLLALLFSSLVLLLLVEEVVVEDATFVSIAIEADEAEGAAVVALLVDGVDGTAVSVFPFVESSMLVADGVGVVMDDDDSSCCCFFCHVNDI